MKASKTNSAYAEYRAAELEQGMLQDALSQTDSKCVRKSTVYEVTWEMSERTTLHEEPRKNNSDTAGR
jgi:hypothetical protein